MIPGRRSLIVTAALAALALGACAGDDDGMEMDTLDETGVATQPGDTAAQTGGMAGMEPDTTEQGLYSYLQDEDYRNQWQLWPGSSEYYEGNDPHGMLLTTYVNDAALQAIEGGSPTDMPEGAIIVKENFAPDSSFAASTVMYKVDGYAPDHADWLWAKYDTAGTAEAFGRAQGCQSCHQQAENGYLYSVADF